MKKIFIAATFVCISITAIAQKKPAKQPQGMPSQAEIEKMMKQAGLSTEDMKAVKDLMKEQSNSTAAKNQEMIEANFNNANFIPPKNTAKIASIKPAYSQAELLALTNILFTKLSVKGKASEIALAKKLIAELKTTTDLLNAAVVALGNGQMHTALMLALKALQMKPDNIVAQNNVAAILTQCGYPDKAMPYLVELLKKDPGNSTLLNNTAFAWLGLGDEDKAYRHIYRALQINPSHPQANSCAAVILDKKGYKAEAKKLIQKAAANNFTESMQKLNSKINNTNESQTELDWEDLAKKITIYEYFKPDDKKINWPDYAAIKTHSDIPSLLQIMESEKTMRRNFENKIDKLLNEYAKGYDKEVKVSDILNQAKKTGKWNSANAQLVGIAGKVVLAISNHLQKIKNEHINLLGKNELKIKQAYEQVKKGSKVRNREQQKEMCERIGNRLVSQAMENINPGMLAYMQTYEQEIRHLTNALLTWVNIQSTASSVPDDMRKQQLIGFATVYLIDVPFAESYVSASTAANATFYADPCLHVDKPNILNYEHPLLPDFDCPIVYSIPSGFNNMSYGDGSSNNDFNIPQNKNSQFIQNTISYSTSSQYVSEAGTSPYYNTDNTGRDLSFGIADDEDVFPLAPSKNNKSASDDDEVVPLAPSPKKVTGADDDDVVPLAPSKKTRDAQAAAHRKATRELLNQYTEKYCKDELGQKANRKEKLKEKINKLLNELEREEANELKAAEEKQKIATDDVYPLAKTKPEDIKKYYQDIKASLNEAANNQGLTPSISNGLTVVGKIAGFVKGLFD